MAAATKVQHSKFDPQQINPGLEVLYPNDEHVSSKVPIKVDIIAIPGLGANPQYTWKKNKVDWLRDSNMLARKIPNARISVFQYQSQWFGKGSIDQRLENVANQLLYALANSRRHESKLTPIIFVSHCLGGIILEKMLLTSKVRQGRFDVVYDWVAGCIFLGTPFHGTRTQSKAMVLAEMAESVGWATSSSLLKLLEEDSDTLRTLLDDFALLAREAQIRLFCFFEEDKSDLVGLFIKGSRWKSQELIVDERSATITSVEKLPLKSDHFNLNKFEGPKDGNFAFVSDEIRYTAQKAEGILKTRQKLHHQALVNDSTKMEMIDRLGADFQNPVAAMNGSFKGSKDTKLSSVLELETFKKWRNSECDHILWVHGKAGTGQGPVASSAIKFLKDSARVEESREHGSIIASFFCDESDMQRRSLGGLLQMIIRQVIVLDGDLARHLLSDSRKSKQAGKQTFDPDETLKVPALWDALHKMARDLSGGSIYIIIYGLENLDTESLAAFLKYVEEFPDVGTASGGDSHVRPMKWLLLSRTGRPKIGESLKPKALEINLEDEENSKHVSDDLRTHISGCVDELSLPSSLAYFVKRHVHSRAEGNFIYVSLVIQELKNAWVPGHTQHSDIRKLLESFPYGLTNMFEHVRRRVLDPHAKGYEYTKELLRCRICAYVAPTMRQLGIIAGIPAEDRKDNEKLKAYIVRCGAFLTLRGDGDPDSNTVEWVDVSAQEHLEKNAKEDLSLDLSDIQHGIIALRSLEYIYHAIDQGEAPWAKNSEQEDDEVENCADEDAAKSVQASESNKSEQDQDREDSNAVVDKDETNASSVAEVEESETPLENGLEYLIRYWVEHAKRAPPDVLDEFNFLHPFWEDDSKSRQKWWGVIKDEQSKVSALHVGIILQFSALVDYYLDNGWTDDIHKEDSLGFQPLYYACRGGQEEMVNALLGVGADINFVSDNSGNPAALHAASSNGHHNIVNTLLDRDADINATTPNHGTALYTAAANNFNDIVKLLLNRGAKVNVIGGNARRALNVAAFVGNLDAVRILIEKGADVDPDEEYSYGSALGAAARRGHVKLVKYLLSQGWNPCRSMKTYGSFLTVAATYNHLELLETLLEKEERVFVLEQALQAAAQRGYAPIVKAILGKAETSPHKVTLPYQRAFSLAASHSRLDVLRLLLPRGIDQDQLDKALYQATDNEHEDTVQLLLEYNADPNAEGPEYGFALAASAYDGTTDILKALIEKGADVNKRGGEYGTALQAAAWFGDVTNVALLLDNGAKINTEPIGYYGTELQAAVHDGDEDVIRLLIQKGADVNAFGGHFSYPIIAAVEQGDSTATNILLEHHAHVNVRGGEDNWPVISLAASNLLTDDLGRILKNGADINATCDKGTTALINCADACDAEGLQFLIDNNADVHIVSEKYGTALHAAAAEGDEDCCEVLLKADAHVDSIGGPWGTALQAAAWAEDIETVRVLLDAGADVSSTGPVAGDYGTALQAASFGWLEGVQELLGRGAAVNTDSANGKYGNALASAAAIGNEDIAKLLIEHGADVNAKGGLYEFPILAAAQSGDASVVNLLLENGANASAQGGLLGSAVAAAAYGDSLSIMEKLVEHGADVNAKGGKYGDAMQAAAMKADLEIIDNLLDRATDLVNHRDGKYHTALIAAAYFNRMEVVTKLINGGADFRIQGGKYRSAITAAARRGNKVILDTFLAMDPPVQMLDEALVEACAFRQSACVEALLKSGATLRPTLVQATEALAAPAPDDSNSDVDDDDEDDDDDEEEDDDSEEEESDDEWEGDNISVSGQTDEGSVTDLQLEEELSEETKIRNMLEEAMARCKRNPTIGRIKTVKRRGLPPSLSIGAPPPPSVSSIPSTTTFQSSNVQSNKMGVGPPYAQHQQESWIVPPRPRSDSERNGGSYGQSSQGQSASGRYTAYPAPIYAQQQAQAPSSMPQQVQPPQELHRRQFSAPPPQREREHSTGRVPQSYTPPFDKGNEDHGLKRHSKALNRKPIGSPGLSGSQQQQQQQRQSSYPKSQPPFDRSVSENDYAAKNQYTPPPPPSYNVPTAPQQHPPPLPQRRSQYFSPNPPSAYQSPPSGQYPPYTSPPVQRPMYVPYSQGSEPSSQASIQSSQYASSTSQGTPYGAPHGSQYAPWDPAASNTGGPTNTQEPNETQGRRWTRGGYDGEGYGR